MAELALRHPSVRRTGSSLLADDLVDSGPGALSPFSEGLDGHSTTVELAPVSGRLARTSSRRLVRPRRRRASGTSGAITAVIALLATAALVAIGASLVLDHLSHGSAEAPSAAQAPR